MKVVRADVMGMCFGVRDALREADRVAEPRQVVIHGELVHNEAVLTGLKSRGFTLLEESGRTARHQASTVMITAHGISQAERGRLESAGKRLLDTTCPLVAKVHTTATALAEDGFHVLVIGRRGHVEVRGIVEDLPSYDVVQSIDDVRPYPFDRLGVVCQTTVAPHDAERIHAAIRHANPTAEVRFVDTVCQPTRDRQNAVGRLAAQVDCMVVVGGRNSNNTRQLVERCRELGVPVHQVQGAADVDPAWFRGFETVGLTAGTSTLDATIDEVHGALLSIRPHDQRAAPAGLHGSSSTSVSGLALRRSFRSPPPNGNE
jgi:4-hydroxy-3-methylbut-2-enyl diphosphate reductase